MPQLECVRAAFEGEGRRGLKDEQAEAFPKLKWVRKRGKIENRVPDERMTWR